MTAEGCLTAFSGWCRVFFITEMKGNRHGCVAEFFLGGGDVGRCVKMCDFNDVGTSLCDVKPERQHIGPTCQRHVPTFRLF